MLNHNLIKKITLLKIVEDMDMMADEIIESQNLNELAISELDKKLRSEGGYIDPVDLHDLKNISNKHPIKMLNIGLTIFNIYKLRDNEISKKIDELFIILCISHYIKYFDNFDKFYILLERIFCANRVNITIEEHNYFKKGINYIPGKGNKTKFKKYIASLIEDLLIK